MLFFRLECIDKAVPDMINLLCESQTQLKQCGTDFGVFSRVNP